MALVKFFQATGEFSPGNVKQIALCKVCPEKRSFEKHKWQTWEKHGCGKCVREGVLDCVEDDDGIVEEPLRCLMEYKV